MGEKERQKEKTNTKSEVAEVDKKDVSEASTPPEESNPNTKTNTKSEAPLPPQDSSPSSDYQTNRRRRKKDTWNVDCERRFTHGAPCTTGPYQKYAGRCCAATCLKLRSWIRCNFLIFRPSATKEREKCITIVWNHWPAVTICWFFNLPRTL